MGFESEKLVKEIHENARRDRKLLEEFCDALKKIDDKNDPAAKAAMIEDVAKLVDCLTKSNAQLVELAKIVTRREISDSSDTGTRHKNEDIFNEIGDGFGGSARVTQKD
jgi:hypothetical protein